MDTPDINNIRNARIVNSFLGFEDHGIMTGTLMLDYGSVSQGFGGYAIRGPYASLWIERVLNVVGVESWEQLKGQHLRAVIGEDQLVSAIGHILKDQWFCPKEEFAELRKRNEEIARIVKEAENATKADADRTPEDAGGDGGPAPEAQPVPNGA